MIKLETRFCTLCGPQAEKQVKYPPSFSEEDLNAAVFSARRMPDRRHFRLVECTDCGIIYSDPACDPSSLAALYQESSVTYGDQEEQIFQSYAPVLDRALARTRNRGTFLEIGGGRGFMLRYGAENGFSCQIEIEPSADAEKKFQKPVGSTNAQFIRGVFEKGALPANSVSLACFFQMLDHVPNPQEFLRAVFDVLEPGGVAVCVTHNTQALTARFLGEKSPIYDIEHTYLFNPGNMAQLFKRVGFETIDTFDVANRYAIKYWMNLVPVPKPVKKALLPTLKATRLADLRIKLKAGNFGIISQKS